MVWKDVTSFSHQKKKETRTVVAYVDCLKVCVTRHVHYPPDMWLADCSPFLDLKELKSKELEKAKNETVSLLKEKLEKCISDLE